MKWSILFSPLTLTLLFSPTALAGEESHPIPPNHDNPAQLRNITIDKRRKEVHLRVRPAAREGILEYLLVGERGKTYESVFKLAEDRGSDLHFALLLIGCEPVDFEAFRALLDDQDGGETRLMEAHASSLLTIDLYRDGQAISLGKVLKDREHRNDRLVWVFTGGFFTSYNRFAPDVEMSLIGLWPDRSALINLFSRRGNPYRGDFGFELDWDSTSPMDQEFTLVLRKAAP